MELFNQEKMRNDRVLDAVWASKRIRSLLFDCINGLEENLTRIRNLTQKYGKSDIATALGSDASELNRVYSLLQTVVKAIDTERDVPNIDAVQVPK